MIASQLFVRRRQFGLPLVCQMACRTALCRVNAVSVNRTDRHRIPRAGAHSMAAKMSISAHASAKAKAPGAKLS
jgi:hypothetical protein